MRVDQTSCELPAHPRPASASPHNPDTWGEHPTLIWDPPDLELSARVGSCSSPIGSSRPARWGLAAKLFATLILMGAIAVLVTAGLGYVRARDAIEKVVFDQLTTARQTKARQVETYFRTIHAELRLLASSKMVVDATREFRVAVSDLRPS